MFDVLRKSPAIQSIVRSVKEGSSLLFETFWDAPRAALTLIASKVTGKNILIVTGGETRSHLFDDLTFFLGTSPLSFPPWDTLPGEEISPSPDIIGKRFEILGQLLQGRGPHTLLTPLQGIMQRVCSPSLLQNRMLHIRQGDLLPFDTFPKQLTALGYHRESVVSNKGEFAVRGGIIDIFPISSFNPYRFDFFGDTIEEIRIYDPSSQRSISKQKEVTIHPAEEIPLLLSESTSSTLLDYLGNQTIILFDDLLSIENHYVALKELPTSTLSLPLSSLLEQVASLQTLYCTEHNLQQLSQGERHTLERDRCNGENLLQEVSFEIFNRHIRTKRIDHPFVPIDAFLGSAVEKEKHLESALHKFSDISIIFVTASRAEERYVKEKISQMLPPLPKDLSFKGGYLSSGCVLSDIPLVLISLPELTKRYKVSRQKWRNTYHTPMSGFHSLEKGSLVVHFHNGVGKYHGIEKQKNHLGDEEEFLVLEYANSSRLYVPLSQSYLVNRYVGADDKTPKLNTLGTKKWQQTRAHAQKAIVGYAKDLLSIQAQREAMGGHIYPKDTDDMLLFEEAFPFVATEDQLKAIREIKTDMESPKAMNRLVCGDVGYGKTEVAMRASFKAAVDGGKQVAMLVPTTVLAMQHYETFQERMSDFSISIGVISRFIRPKQCKQTLEGVARGEIDILIGTHRIISKDVQFKNLGLIIIDEEQRFGVRAKEHLKKAKIGVDCLTLSATPIPRTLYFSLVGARDMSIINTPPQDRLPIKTILAERRSEVIKEALLRELARDGQAYFVHNRVETIDRVAKELQTLLPHARITVGHGQMPSNSLDLIFHKFKEGEVDVLVATTIVENGVDIPNANTILVDRADTFGMADLYQLRGRVGRWNRPAYAYFLLPKHREILEISQKRLQALVETSGFGGGMKLAMRDLEIRGAGNLLGVQQSGNISSIGLYAYCKSLKRAINSLKRRCPPAFVDTQIEFSCDAKLPPSYIPETTLRMEIYHRLGESTSNEEVEALSRELTDRFGPFPKQVAWLMTLSRIRIFASTYQFAMLQFDQTTLHAKRHFGEGQIYKKIPLPPTKDPQDFEAIVMGFLKRDFNLEDVTPL